MFVGHFTTVLSSTIVGMHCATYKLCTHLEVFIVTCLQVYAVSACRHVAMKTSGGL